MSYFSAGNFLRDRRLQRGWTLTQVAQKAGIAKSTLSKWENGCVRPRVPELGAVMSVLEVPVSERALLLQQWGLGASLEISQISGLHRITGGFPIHGDLLRSMRHRALLSQQEAAQKIGIAQGTLAKWEQGSDWPDAERLHSLAFALGATADEVAVLSTGVPTLFSRPEEVGSARTEADLNQVEAEILVLKMRSYFQPFFPYDLWFLSLMARLGPASLRDDSLGQRAFVLWAGNIYLYLVWLIQSYRRDTSALTWLFLERVRPRLNLRSDVRLWGFFIWVAQLEVTAPMHWFLEDPKNYLSVRQGYVSVSSHHVRVIRELTAWLEALVHSKPKQPIQQILALNDAEVAFLAALSGDACTAEQHDIRVNRFFKTLEGRGADIATDRANMHYILGDLQRALEVMPDIPPAEPINGAETSMELVRRLERTRFRARVLLEQDEKHYREEGRHLLETFHRELELLPHGSIRAGLGPIPAPDRGTS